MNRFKVAGKLDCRCWLGRLLVCMLAVTWPGETKAVWQDGAQPPETATDAPSGHVDFNRHIRPILAKHCFACHGPDDSHSGLRLDSLENARLAADSGEPAIVPGSSGESELVRRVRSEEPQERMPPEGAPLSQEQIAWLSAWIDQGAQYSQHWAFEPPTRPSLPDVQRSDWVRTPVDRYILAELERQQLSPAPTADPRTLIRRLYYDLIGVPPTAAQVAAFEADPSDQAYERLVDTLLADPRHGERWARHWLDVVRYAETNSFERDSPKPNAWRYRDYVIAAFNRDKPYDRFLAEQLAGDQLDPVTAETLTATGFYRLGIWDDEPADRLLAEFDQYDDMVSTIGQAFLGLTIGCSRCHDHKIDPLPQSDYYQLVAVVRDIPSYGQGHQRDVSPEPLQQAYSQLEQAIGQLDNQLREIEQAGIEKMDAPQQRATEGPQRQEVLDQYLEQFVESDIWQRYTLLKRQREQLRRDRRQLPPRQMVLAVAGTRPTPPPTYILLRGNPHAEGPPVQPGFPGVLGARHESPSDVPAHPRIELARWMTDAAHPLTARVIVNRIWQHHFGRGLVASPNNFGQMGDFPSHPELLDWLATELIEQRWQLKSLHRMLVLSSVYRQGSPAPNSPQLEAGLRLDPAATLLWRFPPRRLSAEELRDSVLAVSGNLTLQAGGPSIYPEVAAEVKAGQSVPGQGWNDSSETDRHRRSVYIHIKRSLIIPELATFDFPETDTSCEARFLTNQPGQALEMLNGSFLNTQARQLASLLQRIVDDPTTATSPVADDAASSTAPPRDPAGDATLSAVATELLADTGGLETTGQDIPTATLQQLFRQVLQRPATDSELARWQQLNERLAQQYDLEWPERLRLLSLVLLNSNEFLYLD
jgi:mono/diheme cytochrome c family protein